MILNSFTKGPIKFNHYIKIKLQISTTKVIGTKIT